MSIACRRWMCPTSRERGRCRRIQLGPALHRPIDGARLGLFGDAENLPLIASICRRLYGIPLAIEFAAARAATLGLQQVTDRLNDRFGLLTAGRRRRCRGTRPSVRRSIGAINCCRRRSGHCCSGCRFSWAGSRSRRRPRSWATPALLPPWLPTALQAWRLSRWYPWTRRCHRAAGNSRDHPRLRAREAGRSGDAGLIARRHAEFFRNAFAPAAESPRVALDDLPHYIRDIDNLRAALDWAFSHDGGDVGLRIGLAVAATPVLSRRRCCPNVIAGRSGLFSFLTMSGAERPKKCGFRQASAIR